MAFNTEVHAAKKFRLGTRVRSKDNKEYIYLKGATTITAAGMWVTFDENFAPTLLAANAVGPVAVTQAVVNTASKYGWFQIYGNYASASSDTTSADKALFIDGTAGRVDDAAVTGDLVVGAFSTAGDTTNVLPVFLNYPFVTDALG